MKIEIEININLEAGYYLKSLLTDLLSTLAKPVEPTPQESPHIPITQPFDTVPF